jgi:glycosyltransferase involved in cell wall biosynthesis
VLDALVRWFWNKRMKSYRFSLAISEFAREWARTYWGVECGILHPPCRMLGLSSSKEDIILSAGRFSPGKRQAPLMKAYGLLEPDIPQSWRYHSIGVLAPDHADYFREVAALAEGRRAELRTDLPRESLDEEFRKASIFWQGVGEEGGEVPAYAEHFGITTVEAMSAGCVPVVYNKGGHREIVEHGTSGFLWNTVEELLSYTRELIANSTLRAKIAEAASLRAKSFSQEVFINRFKAIVASSVDLD